MSISTSHCKVVLLGAGGAGKSWITIFFLNSTFVGIYYSSPFYPLPLFSALALTRNPFLTWRYPPARIILPYKFNHNQIFTHILTERYDPTIEDSYKT